MPEGQWQQFCEAFLQKGAACRLNPCPTPHIRINNLPATDKKLWTNHVRHAPCTSFNTETVKQALVMATLPKEETGETNT